MGGVGQTSFCSRLSTPFTFLHLSSILRALSLPSHFLRASLVRLIFGSY
jgi:hypothetical protein